MHEEQNWKCRIFIFRQRMNDTLGWFFGANDFFLFLEDTRREIIDFLLSFRVFLIIFRRGSRRHQFPIIVIISSITR
jgi:hypothetical protein